MKKVLSILTLLMIMLMVNGWADSAIVKVWDTQLTHFTKDGCRTACTDQVRLYVHFHNLGDKAISGITINVHIFNSNNKRLMKFTVTEDVRLAPKTQATSVAYRYWSQPDATYDLLAMPALTNSASVLVTIDKVYFADGTTDSD
jgi:hypothetical protein